MTLAVSNPPLKWPGGKHYLAPTIHALAARTTYTHRVIGYAGGLGEFWNWPCEGVSEVVNDIDYALTNFYRVLQNPEMFKALQQKLTATPFSQVEFHDADDVMVLMGFHGARAPADMIDYAHAFFVRVRQSMMGMQKGFTPLTRTRTRKGMNAEVSAWFGAIEGLDQVSARIMRAVVCNEQAPVVARREDGPETLHYFDPTYFGVKGLYQNEMTYEEHLELLETVCSLKGKVIISTYPNELYQSVLGDWNCEVIEIDNKMGKGKKKDDELELLLYNF